MGPDAFRVDRRRVHPLDGSRRLVVFLKAQGHAANRKRVQRLMGILGLAGMASGPATSKPHPEHPVYPYLLRGVEVTRPNQVWSTEITDVLLAHGVAYLVAIVDWYSRRVLAWRLSNTLDAGICVDCLEEALRAHGRPEIFNTEGGTVHQRGVHVGALARRDRDQHGRSRAGIGQHFRGATVAPRQGRRYRPQGLHQLARVAPGTDRVFRLLQWRTPSPISGVPDAGGGLPLGGRRGKAGEPKSWIASARPRWGSAKRLRLRSAAQLKFGLKLSWTGGPLYSRLRA